MFFSWSLVDLREICDHKRITFPRWKYVTLIIFINVIVHQGKNAADRWEIAYSSFLTPPTLHDALLALKRVADIGIVVWGGYSEVQFTQPKSLFFYFFYQTSACLAAGPFHEHIKLRLRFVRLESLIWQ